MLQLGRGITPVEPRPHVQQHGSPTTYATGTAIPTRGWWEGAAPCACLNNFQTISVCSADLLFFYCGEEEACQYRLK